MEVTFTRSKPFKLAPLVGCLALLLTLLGCNGKEVQSFDIKVDSITPSTGPYAGGTTIYISGSGLEYLTEVRIGGELCTGLSVTGDSQASCATPAGDVGAATVVLTNTIEKEATAEFTYENVPVVDAITPSVGGVAGGTVISITGTGFQQGADVELAGTPCIGITVVDDTEITCTTPPHSAGFVVATVTNPDGKFTTSRLFAYRITPIVSSVSPTGGNTLGNTTITVTGSGFSIGASVTVGGVLCSGVDVRSSSQLTCITGAHAASVAPETITVTNNTGLSGSSTVGLYTYRPAPTVASMDVVSGYAQGGTTVIVTGTGFLNGVVLRFGNSNCATTTWNSATSATCLTAAHIAGTVNVYATNPDGQVGTLIGSALGGYTYVPPPTVSSISPELGDDGGGTPVTITGTNFDVDIGDTVDFSGSACTVTAESATSISCTTAAHAPGKVNITVTNNDGQDDMLAQAYMYRGQPTVTNVTPSAGGVGGGTFITITGTNFAEGATVDMGGVACTAELTVVDDTTITCKTPVHAAGGVTVTVTNDDLQAGFMNAAYTFQAAPAVTSISPTRGRADGGTEITITGSGFLAGAEVHFGTSPAVPAASLIIDSSTQIRAISPAGAVGPTTITVTNDDEQSGSSAAGAFIYNTVILDVTPSTYGYGNVTTDVPYTFTITNNGNLTSTAITSAITGTDATAFSVTDTCTTLASGASCTAEVTFLGSGLAQNSYSASLSVTAGSASSGTSTLTGSVVSAVLGWDVTPSYDHGPGPNPWPAPDPVTFTLDNSGSSATTAITVSLTGPDASAWVIDTNTCATLSSGGTCTVQVSFQGDTLTTGSYTATLEATANAGGTATITLLGQVP